VALVKKLRPIPILIPSMPKFNEIRDYLENIDESHIYSNFGPLNEQLITRLAKYFNLKPDQVATTSNATLGLQGAITTSDYRTSKNWSVPSWSFTATAAASVASGIAFTFSDVDLEGRVIPHKKSKSIVDVLPYGDELALERLPDSVELVVVDAAASFDSLKSMDLNSPRRIGVVVSLHATKLLGAGEGGVFISNDPEWVVRFKKWSNFGFSEGVSRNSEFAGTNAKLSEYSAAVALASLDTWEVRRNEYLSLNRRALEISLSANLRPIPALRKNFVTPYWIVETETKKHKKEIIQRLSANEISYRNWWGKGCHEMPAYRNIPFSELGNTKQLAEIQLGLPFYSQLTEEEFERISNAIQ